jgi:hypothetical protein
VDCSAYLLYPESSQLDRWYRDLLAAALRVETVEKRKSGACELAMLKRLYLLPKSVVVKVQLRRLVVSPATMEAEELDIRRGKSPQAVPLAMKPPSDLPDSLTSAVPVATPVTPNEDLDYELLSGHVSQSENIRRPSWSDSLRNMAIVSAYVRIQPVTRQGECAFQEFIFSSDECSANMNTAANFALGKLHVQA